jgi:putative CocE/NonD family hydrolase
LSVTVTENLWIPLADGTRLAARLWLPDEAPKNPVPAVLEYIPYRKRDGTRGRDEPMHGFFAEQGFAAIRVDMRGSGESDGLLDDEYLKLEQDDALEVIAWIAAQPWCSGSVGMMGKSWGGFNALQVAARRPPALKAIITVCSTDDRFSDDIHFKGGCLLNDNLWWGAIMLAYQGRPPDPAIVGEGWRDQWLQRLEHVPCWPALWMEHQSRDDYWRHGSVNEDWGAITCPVLAVGGWADAYTNAVPRLLEQLRVPRLGVIGPWAHVYPQDGTPAPAIDFLGEATRWWDHWLKGRDNGVMDAPMLRVFIEDSRKPTTTLTASPGRFVAEGTWPSPQVSNRRFALAPGRLGGDAEGHAPLQIRSPLWTGTAGGEWMGMGVVGEMPGDQRVDDGLSLCFDSPVLEEDVEILGFPVAHLRLAADRPHAQLAARLCSVAPDGSSLRVSYAVLNLSHRAGSAEPLAMVPGKVEDVAVTLDVAGHRFPKGHRIRLAISTAYWPLVWPARDAATLTLYEGGCLELPLRSASASEPVRFDPPRHGPRAPTTMLRDGQTERSLQFDAIGGGAMVTTRGEGGLFGEGVQRFDEIDVSLSHDLTRRLSVTADDPLSARAVIEQRYELQRPDGRFGTVSKLELSADTEHFTLEASLDAFENDTPVKARRWTVRVPRTHL